MKTLIISFIVMGWFSVNPNVDVATEVAAPPKDFEIIDDISLDDEALRCKITTKDGDTYECWLCSCKKLADSIPKEE